MALGFESVDVAFGFFVWLVLMVAALVKIIRGRSAGHRDESD
jgi:hypothetical protein